MTIDMGEINRLAGNILNTTEKSNNSTSQRSEDQPSRVDWLADRFVPADEANPNPLFDRGIAVSHEGDAAKINTILNSDNSELGTALVDISFNKDWSPKNPNPALTDIENASHIIVSPGTEERDTVSNLMFVPGPGSRTIDMGAVVSARAFIKDGDIGNTVLNMGGKPFELTLADPNHAKGFNLERNDNGSLSVETAQGGFLVNDSKNVTLVVGDKEYSISPQTDVQALQAIETAVNAQVGAVQTVGIQFENVDASLPVAPLPSTGMSQGARTR